MSFIYRYRPKNLGPTFANSSSTDFPVSRTDDRRLLANTSGDTLGEYMIRRKEAEDSSWEHY